MERLARRPAEFVQDRIGIVAVDEPALHVLAEVVVRDIGQRRHVQLVQGFFDLARETGADRENLIVPVELVLDFDARIKNVTQPVDGEFLVAPLFRLCVPP